MSTGVIDGEEEENEMKLLSCESGGHRGLHLLVMTEGEHQEVCFGRYHDNADDI